MRSYLDDFTRREWQHESPAGTVRLAVVGLGEFARDQALPGIEDSEFCNTTTLVTGSSDKGKRIADKRDIDHVLSYDAFHDGEAADDYDAVYVATPTGQHLQYVETAAELGKDVITEKPMEKSVERAERLREVCEAAEITLMVAYRPRMEPVFQRARELVHDDGVVGEVTEIHAQFAFDVLDIGGPDQWRIDRDLAGGGALMDAGVYTATIARFFADSNPASVQGETVAEHEAFDEDVEERAAYTVQFENGVTASCSTSFNSARNDWVEIIGTEGTLRIEPAFWFNVDRDLSIERDDWEATVTGPSVDEVREEFDHFGYAVLTDTDPEPNAAVGIGDLKLLEGVYESANTGERVQFN
ncbi:gfo/Idh/MocA family oxidoreductase [halophilic archaeon]|nr:gfo/Idh/MocA family oxidoreductase [halophilic archaeon]